MALLPSGEGIVNFHRSCEADSFCDGGRFLLRIAALDGVIGGELKIELKGRIFFWR